jgi:hypothetical protein
MAFFAAMIVERGASATPKQSAATPAPVVPNGSDGFQPGVIAPAQGQPSTSTGTS